MEVPLSTVAKAALCICPPALMAGTVATVPSVKRAVHHLTSDYHAPKPVRKIAATGGPVRSQAIARQPDCDPGGSAVLPAVPLVTYASPIPDEPAAGGIATPVGAVPIVGALGVGGARSGMTTTPAVPGTFDPGAVPEPSAWLMVVLGVGTLGGALRRRRRRIDPVMASGHGWARKASLGTALWSGSAAVEAGDIATTVAVKSAVASAAGKALLCVCPAAIVAGSVMTVSPLRHAVHDATFTPQTAPLVIANSTLGAQPCTETMTVPVATTAVEGFPASVETIAVPAPATATSVESPTKG